MWELKLYFYPSAGGFKKKIYIYIWEVLPISTANRVLYVRNSPMYMENPSGHVVTPGSYFG